jgi:hypothetical protein
MMELFHENDDWRGPYPVRVGVEKVRAMKTSKNLIESWRADPAAEASVIVHVDGPASKYASKVAAYGLKVDRIFELTDTLSASGTGRAMLGLLEEPWVNRIELDQEIRATG